MTLVSRFPLSPGNGCGTAAPCCAAGVEGGGRLELVWCDVFKLTRMFCGSGKHHGNVRDRFRVFFLVDLWKHRKPWQFSLFPRVNYRVDAGSEAESGIDGVGALRIPSYVARHSNCCFI